MSSARISSAGLADTETLLNLLQRKSAVRADLQHPAGSAQPSSGFVPAVGAAGDAGRGGSAGKYSISSETMAFLLTVQQTAVGGPGGAGPSRAGGAPGQGAAAEEARIDQIFSALDADQDGRVGRAEFVSFIEARGGTASFAARMFDKIDATDQGYITRDRMAAAVRHSTGDDPADPSRPDDDRPPVSVSA